MRLSYSSTSTLARHIQYVTPGDPPQLAAVLITTILAYYTYTIIPRKSILKRVSS